MPRYIVTLTDEERNDLRKLVLKGGKGYRIRHAQILLELDSISENASWTQERIIAAYGATRATIAGVAKQFIFEGQEAALGRKQQENRKRKVTGDVEARIIAIACSKAPEGRSRWTMKMIANELIRLEAVEYISNSTICAVLKKTRLSHG